VVNALVNPKGNFLHIPCQAAGIASLMPRVALIEELGHMDSMRSVGTLTRADLAETINRKLGFSRAESLELVESILNRMCDAMAAGENVKISGFGSFVLRDKKERIGRNPKTGVEVPITPRRVMTFRASQKLKDRIAKGT
jgi:integration host factor subunit alpha